MRLPASATRWSTARAGPSRSPPPMPAAAPPRPRSRRRSATCTSTSRSASAGWGRPSRSRPPPGSTSQAPLLYASPSAQLPEDVFGTDCPPGATPEVDGHLRRRGLRDRRPRGRRPRRLDLLPPLRPAHAAVRTGHRRGHLRRRGLRDARLRRPWRPSHDRHDHHPDRPGRTGGPGGHPRARRRPLHRLTAPRTDCAWRGEARSVPGALADGAGSWPCVRRGSSAGVVLASSCSLLSVAAHQRRRTHPLALLAHFETSSGPAQQAAGGRAGPVLALGACECQRSAVGLALGTRECQPPQCLGVERNLRRQHVPSAARRSHRRPPR